MTKVQKETLHSLRLDGYGYAAIADTLSLSINTVKSYCQRNSLPCVKKINSENIPLLYCQHCGKKLIQKTKCKPRKFCSDKCRLAWWNTHPSEVNRKAYYNLICEYCGKEFTVYGRQDSKFCSRSCAGHSRTKMTEVSS